MNVSDVDFTNRSLKSEIGQGITAVDIFRFLVDKGLLGFADKISSYPGSVGDKNLNEPRYDFVISAVCLSCALIRVTNRDLRKEISMIYYQTNSLVIRNMKQLDAQIFTDVEVAQGWHTDISKYLMRLKDQAEGKSISLTAEYEGYPAGYVNVYLIGLGGPFCGMKLPEIVDFGVLEKYRRKGIGSKLMDVAEQIAGQYADTVWLGVGLHSGYGSAQRMYVKRGYIPDGSGIWYQDRPCRPYEAGIANDDELVLYLSKELQN